MAAMGLPLEGMMVASLADGNAPGLGRRHMRPRSVAHRERPRETARCWAPHRPRPPAFTAVTLPEIGLTTAHGTPILRDLGGARHGARTLRLGLGHIQPRFGGVHVLAGRHALLEEFEFAAHRICGARSALAWATRRSAAMVVASRLSTVASTSPAFTASPNRRATR